ncbi:MAG TPA: exodeoxyribonuclease VII small subunit [Ignavibacteriaceae bacterium]|nr:exodeoxyribonuclease VII small subunit [Ignavibacteriaceae bacterium]
MAKKTSKDTFENKLLRLEEIAQLLEGDEVGLEDAITLYQEGIELSRNCITTLKDAELRITQLKKNLDTLTKEEEKFIEE